MNTLLMFVSLVLSCSDWDAFWVLNPSVNLYWNVCFLKRGLVLHRGSVSIRKCVYIRVLVQPGGCVILLGEHIFIKHCSFISCVLKKSLTYVYCLICAGIHMV